MKLRSLAAAVGLSLLISVAPAFAALPTVTTFSVAPSAESPVPVTAFTASDSDGTVVGYMITQTSTKPPANDSRWASNPWTSFTTTSFGALTLYAWAKDNAAGVSNSRTATTNVVGGHVHPMSEVTGLTSALAGKANVTHAHAQADVTGLAASLAGKSDVTHTHKYGKVAIVAQSGGDYADPVIALDGSALAQWCGAPSSSNPCLLKIMPGVYNLGSNTMSMQEYVDVEGSGENATVIKGTPSSSMGVVSGANNSELRLLTVENQGGTGIVLQTANTCLRRVRVLTHTLSAFFSENIAIYIEGSSPRIVDTDIEIIGAAEQGLAGYGIQVASGSLMLDRVSIHTVNQAASIATLLNMGEVLARNCTINSSAPHYAIMNGGNFRLINSSISAVQVLFNQGVASIDNSELVNPAPVPPWGFLLSNLSTNAATYLNNVKLDGNFLGNYTGSLKCINIYDGSYNTMTCP